jgi:hypothetical protein
MPMNIVNKPFKAPIMRVTRLNPDGTPPTSGTPGSQLATAGFISVSLTAQVQDGTDITSTRADGSFCISERTAAQWQRLNVEMELCGINPQLLALITNAETYQDYAANDAGIVIAEGTLDKVFAVEFWLNNSGAPGTYTYLLLPMVRAGVLGDISITGDAPVAISMTGGYTIGGNAWGVGPYDVMTDTTQDPAPLPLGLDSLDHVLIVNTDVAPPPETDGIAAMP